MKLIAYCRISTRAQEDNTSLASQQQRIEAYCLALGHELVDKYIEIGSGKDTKGRPQYRAMMARLETDVEVQGVISLKLDRISRSVRDTLTLVEDILVPLGKALILVDMALDTSSPTGRMVLTMLAAVAALERETIIARSKAGKAYIRSQGRWDGSGSLTFGFTPKDGSLVEVPEEQAVINLMNDLYSKGYSQQDIADELNNRGLKTKLGCTWRQEIVSRTLKRSTKQPRLVPKSHQQEEVKDLVWEMYLKGFSQNFIAQHLRDSGYISARGGQFTQVQVCRILKTLKVQRC